MFDLVKIIKHLENTHRNCSIEIMSVQVVPNGWVVMFHMASLSGGFKGMQYQRVAFFQKTNSTLAECKWDMIA